MRRLHRLTLGACLLAPLCVGCQSSRQTVHTQPAAIDQPASVWSADGDDTRANLVTNDDGAAKVRFASRGGDEAGPTLPNLIPAGRSENRIPLPRTSEGRLRDIDAAQGEQPIGAF